MLSWGTKDGSRKYALIKMPPRPYIVHWVEPSLLAARRDVHQLERFVYALGVQLNHYTTCHIGLNIDCPDPIVQANKLGQVWRWLKKAKPRSLLLAVDRLCLERSRRH